MMKKHISAIALALAACLTLTPFSTSAAASYSYDAEGNTIEITGPAPLRGAFDLSLEDALEKLDTDSIQIQLINIQHLGEEAVAKGADEGLEQLEDARKALKKLNSLARATGSEELAKAYSSASFSYTSTQTTRTLLNLKKDFAAQVLEANDTARKNNLHLSAVELYYNLKNLESQVAIAEDNLNICNEIYDLTQKKYELGTVSKMELLNAETNVKNANDGLTAAKNALSLLRMNFNIYFGYSLNQKVNLTSELEEIPLSSTPIYIGVRQAKDQRLSIKEAAYNLKLAEENLSNYSAYPRSSASYIGATASYLAAQAANNVAADTVEMDVRTNYMAMNKAYADLQSSKISVENAKETERLARLQYEAGYTTHTTVEQAQLASYNAQIEQAKTLLDLNLAVQHYDYSIGVGLEPAALS